MIFLTVGHQMPFDRMIRIVDGWAAKSPAVPIFAQIGESDYRPRHLEFTQILTRREFDAQLDRSSSVISHAGTGTIIQVLAKGKPLLVFPRLSRFAETRNDHQVGTARHFAASGQLMAAFDEMQFLACLDRFREFRPKRGISGAASPELLSRLRCFISAVQVRRSGESD
jgi:UDP-N-acetylglucosamine transferase subunit ALG13